MDTMEQKEDTREKDLQPVEEEQETRESREMTEKIEAHIRSLQEQAEALRKQWPGFDLAEELQDDRFFRLTAPDTGLTVEDAFYALHREEIRKKEEEEITRKIVNTVRVQGLRPLEAGTGGQAPSLTTFDYATATREERENFKEKLRRYWRKGENYPARQG